MLDILGSEITGKLESESLGCGCSELWKGWHGGTGHGLERGGSCAAWRSGTMWVGPSGRVMGTLKSWSGCSVRGSEP